ncbi:unnamed protein product [Schistocephalus solidus]|uniref:Vesicle transport protein GOT1B n=1 Tax=Schistocephalus solidus TaxID=70667 RepID=A0A3P7DEQ1_SCHSO|nr:unnamed protein product [Schistocephalus solidus]
MSLSLEIGLALMSVGIAFLFLGMLLLFDGGLLALGNLIFILGLGLFIGAERITRFFFQWHKVKGTSFFFGGMFVVIFGFPLIGILIELYGSFLLFSGFLPVIFNFLYRVPVLGWLLTLPGINRVSNTGRLFLNLIDFWQLIVPRGILGRREPLSPMLQSDAS